MKRAALATVALPLIVGASCGTSGSRPCTGFDLPQAQAWATVTAVGETATFADDSGEVLMLVLLSREDNEPYEGSDRFGAEEVVCTKRSNRRYLIDGRDAALDIEMRQAEGLDTPFEDQPFSIAVTPEVPVGTALDYGFLFSANDPEADYEGGVLVEPNLPYVLRVLTDVEIGGSRYAVAVENLFTDPDYVLERVPDGALAIDGVVFAEGAGLVRIDTADGRSFARTGPARP